MAFHGEKELLKRFLADYKKYLFGFKNLHSIYMTSENVLSFKGSKNLLLQANLETSKNSYHKIFIFVVLRSLHVRQCEQV